MTHTFVKANRHRHAHVQLMKSFLIAILLSPILLSCGSSGPEATVEKSFRCIQKEDYEAYVELLDYKGNFTGKELAEVKETYVGLVAKGGKEIKEEGGLKSWELLSKEIDNEKGTATLKYKITKGNGKTEEQNVELIRDKQGKWVIKIGKR